MADLGLLMEACEDMPLLLDDGQHESTAEKLVQATATTDQDAFTPAKRKGRKRKATKDVEMLDGAPAEAKEMDTESTATNTTAKSKKRTKTEKFETRSVPVPPHRFGPMKQVWLKIVSTVVQHLQCDIQFNVKAKQVLVRKTEKTDDTGNLQKAADFVRAFVIGFDIDVRLGEIGFEEMGSRFLGLVAIGHVWDCPKWFALVLILDAMALVRLDDLFVESFEIADVKPLKGEHLSRAIGRVAGKDGRTKFTIENVTKTRIVLADTKISIMGAFQNCRVARHAVCNLIMGTPPSKVYGNLRSMSSRSMEKM